MLKPLQFVQPDNTSTVPTVALVPAGTITANGIVNLTATFAPGTNNIGYLNIPQNSKSADYTTVLADAGKDIYHPVGDNNARTFTIDSNANVAYPLETVILFTNMAAADVTVAITDDTLVFVDTGTVSTITIPQYNYVAARKVTTTSWLVSGTAGITSA